MFGTQPENDNNRSNITPTTLAVALYLGLTGALLTVAYFEPLVSMRGQVFAARFFGF